MFGALQIIPVDGMHMYRDTNDSRVNKLLQHATNKTQASSDGSSEGCRQTSSTRCERGIHHADCPFRPELRRRPLARVTADVTATVTTSIAGIIKDTVEAAVRRAIEGQSGVTSGDVVDGQAPLLVDQLGADDLPLGLSINTVDPRLSLDTPAGETGLSNLPDHSPIPNSFPIDARIPDNIKDKIWANQYVELGVLIHPQEGDKYSMSMSTASGSPSLCLIPRKQKQITTLDQWNSAFNIFMTIYLTKFSTVLKLLPC